MHYAIHVVAGRMLAYTYAIYSFQLVSFVLSFVVLC